MKTTYISRISFAGATSVLWDQRAASRDGPPVPLQRSEEQGDEEQRPSGGSRSQLHGEAPGKHITDKPERHSGLILITSHKHTNTHTHSMLEKSMNRQKSLWLWTRWFSQSFRGFCWVSGERL